MQLAFTCAFAALQLFVARFYNNNFLFNSKAFLTLFLFISFTTNSIAQQTDTLRNLELLAVKKTNAANSAVPLQQLNRETLIQLNSISVADAVKYFSGVVVKDYGGIGGLKTISVRSLGASHSGVMYDGLIMGDAQAGQTDLGRLSLDNVEQIQLFSNQPTEIMLPARSFAQAALLSITTSAQNNFKGTELAARFKTGSFGFLNPAVLYKNNNSKNFGYAFNAEYQQANGNYRFTDYETGTGNKKRNNSDIRTGRMEADLNYRINDSNKLSLKVYYYDSKRGLPGSVILFNDLSGERLNNNLFFTQASWNRSISRKSKILLAAKYTADYKYYLDPDYPNSAGKLENEFKQQELYGSAVYAYKINHLLSASLSADVFNNSLKRLDAFDQGFSDPSRTTLLQHFAIRFKNRMMEMNGSVLSTISREKVKSGNAANNQQEITPAISASFQPFREMPLRFRVSYKRIFRLPTFDELYYTNIGNTNLRPEYANLFNLGITTVFRPRKFLQEILFTADGYYNESTDKIFAVPRQNLFQWSMLNIGKTTAKGIDLSIQSSFRQWKNINFSVQGTYSYQLAKDKSDKTSLLYNTQLPYTPEHSGSINLFARHRNFQFGYNVILSGYRYRQGEPIAINLVEGWSTHDLNLSWEIRDRKNIQYKAILECNNLYNRQYEIIRYYPMQGFNWRIGLIVTHKKTTT
jgi:vitamin B12 transporter